MSGRNRVVAASTQMREAITKILGSMYFHVCSPYYFPLNPNFITFLY